MRPTADIRYRMRGEREWALDDLLAPRKRVKWGLIGAFVFSLGVDVLIIWAIVRAVQHYAK